MNQIIRYLLILLISISPLFMDIERTLASQTEVDCNGIYWREDRLVPFAMLFRVFGAEVYWDEKNRIATAINKYGPAKSFMFNISVADGNNFALVNGEKVLMDRPAEIVDDKMMIPFNFARKMLGSDVDNFEAVDPKFKAFDVSTLISINSSDDLKRKRDELIKYIWKASGFPFNKMPDIIEEDIYDCRFKGYPYAKIDDPVELQNKDDYNAGYDLKNLKKIDKLVVNMEYGVSSVIYLFTPVNQNNRLVIYHEGHIGHFSAGIKTIQYFLSRGYSVAAIAMPLLGMGPIPEIEVSGIGKIRLYNHNQLRYLESNSFSPIKFFLEPVAVVVNYSEKKGYKGLYMIGFSGGGWVTTLYSAIDTRIKGSYPVAGSLPTFLWSRRDVGDYETFLPDLYAIANYLDLYILGSNGDGREQVQVLNKYDSCCYSGIRYKVYKDTIKGIVTSLGKGSFDVYSDESTLVHEITENSLGVILKNIEENG